MSKPIHNTDYVTDEVLTRYYWCVYCGDLLASENVDHPKPYIPTILQRHYDICKRRE